MIARLLLAGLISSAAAPALAQSGMPDYDPAQSCAEAARRAGVRNNVPSPDCIQGETEARDAIARVWPNLSASARQRCLRLSDRRQSFLILGSCVEREATLQR